MAEQQRAPHITIAGVSDEPANGATAAPPVSREPEPEAGPGVQITSQPGDEEEVGPEVVGADVEGPSDEALVAASGGGLADRMRARQRAMSATEEFPVPGWTLPDGSPGLILVAKTFGDRAAYMKGISLEVFIAKSTHKLLFVDEDGTREEIPGGWGPGLCKIMGVDVAKATDLIRLVISKPDADDPARMVPNVVGIGALAQAIMAWSETGQRQAEEDLGE